MNFDVQLKEMTMNKCLNKRSRRTNILDQDNSVHYQANLGRHRAEAPFKMAQAPEQANWQQKQSLHNRYINKRFSQVLQMNE